MNRTAAVRIGVIVLVGVATAVTVRAINGPCGPRAPGEGPGVSHIKIGGPVLNVAAGPKGLWAIRRVDFTKRSSQLVELDPPTGKIKGAPIELPAIAWTLEVGKDAVWVVASNATPSILRKVDTAERRIVASFRVGRGTSSVSEGDGGVWVANSGNNNILRVNVERRQVLTRVRFDSDPELVVARLGSVWVGTGTSRGVGAVHRIDPATGRITGSMDLSLANVGAGGVWVNENRSPEGRLFRVDPRSFRRVGPSIRNDVGAAMVGIAGDQVWVGRYFTYCNPNIPRGGRGWPVMSVGWQRIDPQSLKPLSGPVHVGENGRTPVFAGGAFWIVQELGQELIRIDLAKAAKVRP